MAAMLLAQPQAYHAPTVEWLVARSDLVMRASVAEVSKEPLPPFRAWIIVTLKVHESLKGTPPETLQFAEDSDAGDKRYDGWKDSGREFLVFLSRNPRYRAGEKEIEARFPFTRYDGSGWTLFRLGPAVPQEERWYPPPSGLFSSTLDVLETPVEILEAARRAVAARRRAVGEVRMHELSLPQRVMEWSGDRADWNFLQVPVDSQLEILARAMIQSPSEVLSKRGNSAGKRKGEAWWDGFWTGRMSAAKNDDERGQVKAGRDRQYQNEIDELRASGVEALGHFKSKENVALLKSLLNDDLVPVRMAAAKAVGKEGAKEAAAALVNLLKDKDASARRAAVMGLGEIGARESVPALMELLKDEDPAIRRAVAWVLGPQLRVKEAAPEFVKLLKDGDASVRAEAAQGLGWVGSRAAAAELVKALQDAEAAVRWNAAGALQNLGAKEAAPDLIRILKDPDLQVRRSAADALAALGAKEAIPEFLRMLRDDLGDDQPTAARALGLLGAKEAVPVLLSLLPHRSAFIRTAAANALGELDASDAVEALRPGLADKVDWVRAEAATALTRLGSKAGVPVLLEEARKGTFTAQLIALNALRQPEVYRKLKAKGLTRDIQGQPEGFSAAWSKEAGLPLVGARRDETQEYPAYEGRTHLLRALESVARSSWGVVVIMEPDQVRLLPPEEALKFWTAWWEGDKQKK